MGMMEERLKKWREEVKGPELSRFPERCDCFRTASGIEVKDVYTPADVRQAAGAEMPGVYPLTRGNYASMYRNRLFTRRQVVGLGTAQDANTRHRFVLAQGQTGLSNDFDLPTLTGYDSDDPLVAGEVGRIGVAIDTLEDMRDLMAGIPMDKVSTSMTINHPAPILLAMYCKLAEEQGIPWDRLSGTLQNDGLKEFFAQKTFALPPAAALRLTVDVIEFCTRNLPRWNPISVSGYQTRDCGGTADQEIGFTFAAAIEYITETLKRGIDTDDFAPRISFLMYIHMDFIEEIAKFRAARRLWARLMRERFGAKRPESWRFRVHVQSGAVLLTAQQPENNIARAAIQCLAGVLGGVQSMALSTFDEAFSIPSEKAQRIALRTQQIVALETGATSSPDPLGGSYMVEALTDELERRAERWIAAIDERGGMLKVTESGWIEAVLAEQAYAIQQRIERGEQPVVGVNVFTEGNEEGDMPNLFRVDPSVEDVQKARLAEVRRRRDGTRVGEALTAVREAAEGNENLLPPILTAVGALASEGEMFAAMRSVWGNYRPLAVF